MSIDPHDSAEPFNRLFDQCKFRGRRLELHAGALRKHGAAAGSRDLKGLAVPLGQQTRAWEAIVGNDVQSAAQRLLMRL